MARRRDHLVVGQATLDEHPSSVRRAPAADETRGAHEEPERLLRRAVPRREQLLVEVEERDESNRPGAIDREPVEDGLGADEHVARADLIGRRVDLDRRCTAAAATRASSRTPVTPDAQRRQAGRVAVQADGRALGAASRTRQRVGLGAYRRTAVLAAGQLVARAAREQPRPAAPVEHAHRPSAAVDRRVQRGGEPGR